MRIALIAIADAGAAGGTLLAGRSIARHQTEFALALGCEKVVLFGDGSTADATALRHAAEKAGAQVQVVPGVRYLPATVRGDDQPIRALPMRIRGSAGAADRESRLHAG